MLFRLHLCTRSNYDLEESRMIDQVIIREDNEEEDYPNEVMNDSILQDVDIPKVPAHTHPQQEPTQEKKIPPFLERQVIEKPINHPEYDILNQT